MPAMLFTRKIEATLSSWKKKSQRKPLILTGARQVWKSTLLQQFGQGYQHFVNLNLERPSYQKYFEREREVKEVGEQIIFEKKMPNNPASNSSTLGCWIMPPIFKLSFCCWMIWTNTLKAMSSNRLSHKNLLPTQSRHAAAHVSGSGKMPKPTQRWIWPTNGEISCYQLRSSREQKSPSAPCTSTWNSPPAASPFGSTATRFPAPPSRLSNSSCSTCRISLARSWTCILSGQWQMIKSMFWNFLTGLKTYSKQTGIPPPPLPFHPPKKAFREVGDCGAEGADPIFVSTKRNKTKGN